MKRLTAFCLALTAMAFAHIKPGSLSIKSGTTYTQGQKVSISWSASIDHNKSGYDLWYSPDAGKNWTSLKTGIPGAANNVLVTYEWTVPSQPTTTGMIRVFQLFGGTVATNPSSPGDYTLFSPAFTIASASAVAPLDRNPPALARKGDFLEIRLESATPQLLEVIGFDGSLRGTRKIAATANSGQILTIPLAELDITDRSLIRLRSGGRVVAQVVVGHFE
ncbi:MAG: hypothetical protein RL173_3382 [Fibrobacterota bacterium]|jgi:hypothetical protein